MENVFAKLKDGQVKSVQNQLLHVMEKKLKRHAIMESVLIKINVLAMKDGQGMNVMNIPVLGNQLLLHAIILMVHALDQINVPAMMDTLEQIAAI